MIYSDPIGKQGIVEDAYFEASANSASYPIEDVTRNANAALDKVISKILGADGRWQFDSSNYTDLPIGATDIILGQQDYSFDNEYLVIKSIEISDAQGNWKRLTPIDNNDLSPGVAMSQLALVTGNPTHYDKMGESILLYTIPNYNRRLVQEGEAGLRAYFQRKIDYFTITDTIKEPGFAKQLHKYIALYCAWVYACAHEMNDKAATLAKRLVFFEGNEELGGNDPGEIKRFYSYREVDNRRRITNRVPVKR